MKKALLLLLLLSCASVPQVIFENDVIFDVEIARTPEVQSKGLMFRESMPENHGMLFVFEGEQTRTFWMKNTLISLDMIFVSADNKVVDIKHNVPPCEEDPCPRYESVKPAMYVLEINGGLAEKKGIDIGNLMLSK
jgi:uncharacterized membrane protein (UPF0127 family)